LQSKAAAFHHEGTTTIGSSADFLSQQQAIARRARDYLHRAEECLRLGMEVPASVWQSALVDWFGVAISVLLLEEDHQANHQAEVAWSSSAAAAAATHKLEREKKIHHSPA
jgi:hypothetical protein